MEWDVREGKLSVDCIKNTHRLPKPLQGGADTPGALVALDFERGANTFIVGTNRSEIWEVMPCFRRI